MIYYVKYCFVALLILTACKREFVFPQREYPIIKTYGVTCVDSINTRFEGEILELGKSNLTEFGFLVDVKSPQIESSNKLVSEKIPTIGKFIVEDSIVLVQNVDYIMRAYALYDSTVVYANEYSFLSKGSKNNPWKVIKPLYNNIKGTFEFNDRIYMYTNDSIFRYEESLLNIEHQNEIKECDNEVMISKYFQLEDELFAVSKTKYYRFDFDLKEWTYFDALYYDFVIVGNGFLFGKKNNVWYEFYFENGRFKNRRLNIDNNIYSISKVGNSYVALSNSNVYISDGDDINSLYSIANVSLYNSTAVKMTVLGRYILIERYYEEVVYYPESNYPDSYYWENYYSERNDKVAFMMYSIDKDKWLWVDMPNFVNVNENIKSFAIGDRMYWSINNSNISIEGVDYNSYTLVLAPSYINY